MKTFYVWLLGEYYGNVNAKSPKAAEVIALEKLPRLLEHWENVQTSPYVAAHLKSVVVSTSLPIYDR